MKNPQCTAVEKQFVTTFPEAIGSNPLKFYLPYAWKTPGTTESRAWMPPCKHKASKNRSFWPPSSCTQGSHFWFLWVPQNCSVLIVLYLGNTCSCPMESQWNTWGEAPIGFLWGLQAHLPAKELLLRAQGSWRKSAWRKDTHEHAHTVQCHMPGGQTSPPSDLPCPCKCLAALLGFPWLGQSHEHQVPYVFSIHRPKCVFGFGEFVPRRRARLTTNSSHFVVICKTATRASFPKPKVSNRELWPMPARWLTTNIYQHLTSLVRQLCFANIDLRGHSLKRSELLFG